MAVQKFLIYAGIVLILAGLAFPLFQKLGLGRLPGDLYVKQENFSFYFPLATCLILSLVLTLIVNLFGRK